MRKESLLNLFQGIRSFPNDVRGRVESYREKRHIERLLRHYDPYDEAIKDIRNKNILIIATTISILGGCCIFSEIVQSH